MIKGLPLGGGLPHLGETIKIKTHTTAEDTLLVLLPTYIDDYSPYSYNHTNSCLVSIISIIHLVARLWRSETLYALLWAACCAAGIPFKHSKK